MIRIITALFITLTLASCTTRQEPVPSGPPPGYKLVWSDEFNGRGLPDPDKWAYDTYWNKKGWWNNELQYYSKARKENARLENGRLILEARRETLSPRKYRDWGGQNYTSARLITKGRDAWRYGYFEIRAKLPCARGSWPAIWTLPVADDHRWPDGGEIDIMEHVGHDPGAVHATVHTGAHNHRDGTSKGGVKRLPNPCGAFHTYTLDWTADRVAIGVDGEIYYTYENTGGGERAWPFDRPHYLLLNIAVGGDWGGAKGVDNAAFPARMEVDYVRIWQRRGRR